MERHRALNDITLPASLPTAAYKIAARSFAQERQFPRREFCIATIIEGHRLLPRRRAMSNKLLVEPRVFRAFIRRVNDLCFKFRLHRGSITFTSVRLDYTEYSPILRNQDLLATYKSLTTKVLATLMEQHRIEGAGETADPRENPLTSSIVRHDSHMRKSESDPARGNGISPRKPADQRHRLARLPNAEIRVRSGQRLIPDRLDRGATVVQWLERPPPPHQGEPGSIPCGVAPGISHMIVVPDDAASQRVSSGISSFRRLCIPALLHSHLIGSQGRDCTGIEPTTSREHRIPIDTQSLVTVRPDTRVNMPFSFLQFSTEFRLRFSTQRRRILRRNHACERARTHTHTHTHRVTDTVYLPLHVHALRIGHHLFSISNDADRPAYTSGQELDGTCMMLADRPFNVGTRRLVERSQRVRSTSSLVYEGEAVVSDEKVGNYCPRQSGIGEQAVGCGERKEPSIAINTPIDHAREDHFLRSALMVNGLRGSENWRGGEGGCPGYSEAALARRVDRRSSPGKVECVDDVRTSVARQTLDT
ncbi:hypothetical protein PR048_025462 [Dryococelus australis]|uniref:Uncharacterized protein n=1 Tax=Dryococelus australis TaxID=614101 RepID=A0ABQ9GRG8_9NEOP|nr:hypothetical protein PR048_025462 [Dryococelus australis]